MRPLLLLLLLSLAAPASAQLSATVRDATPAGPLGVTGGIDVSYFEADPERGPRLRASAVGLNLRGAASLFYMAGRIASEAAQFGGSFEGGARFWVEPAEVSVGVGYRLGRLTGEGVYATAAVHAPTGAFGGVFVRGLYGPSHAMIGAGLYLNLDD